MLYIYTLETKFSKQSKKSAVYKAEAIGVFKKLRQLCLWVYFVTLYLNVYSMLFAKERFGSNLRHAVHTGVYGNAVATYCAVQQIGVPALACALCLLGEMGYVLN